MTVYVIVTDSTGFGIYRFSIGQFWRLISTEGYPCRGPCMLRSVGPWRKCFLVDAITFCTNCIWFCISYNMKTLTNWSQMCCGIWILRPVWIHWNYFGPVWVNLFLISKCKLEKFFQTSLTFSWAKSLDQEGFDWTLSFYWSGSKV